MYCLDPDVPWEPSYATAEHVGHRPKERSAFLTRSQAAPEEVDVPQGARARELAHPVDHSLSRVEVVAREPATLHLANPVEIVGRSGVVPERGELHEALPSPLCRDAMTKR